MNAGSEYNLSIDTKWLGGWARDTEANSGQGILKAAEASLERLKVPKVDVFYLHAPVYNAPIEETLAGIDAAHKAGTFQRFGLSNYPPVDVQKVYEICQTKGLVLPTVYQGNYAAVARKQEDSLIPLLRRLNISFYAYSPIAGGFLTKTRRDIESGGTRFSKDQMYGIYHKLYVNEAYLSALDEWISIARDEGISTAELAYRWIAFNSALKPEFGDRVVLGASSLDQLECTLRFFDRGSLSEQALGRIDVMWEKIKHVAGVDNYQAVMG